MKSELFTRSISNYFHHPTCYHSESQWLNYLIDSISDPSILPTCSITVTTKENVHIPATIITKKRACNPTSIVIASPEPKLLGALLDFPEEYTPLRPLRPHFVANPEDNYELKLINKLSLLGYDESMTFATIFMGLLSTLNIAVDPILPTKVAKHWERTRVS
jgi:hypothetical protein